MSLNKVEPFDKNKTQALKDLISKPFTALHAMELVRQGADPNVRNQFDVSLLKLLCIKKAVEVDELMMSYSRKWCMTN